MMLKIHSRRSKMKKIIAAIFASLLAVSVFAGTIPEGRELYVAAWQFAKQNKYQDVSKYDAQIQAYLMARTPDIQKGMTIDPSEDVYRFQTVQVDKVLLIYSLHIFDWTIKNEDGNVVLTLNDAITSVVSKNGDWNSRSEFETSKILNKKQIEESALADVMKVLEADDEQYAAYKEEVLNDFNFIQMAAYNMGNLGLETFIEENKIIGRTYDFKITVSDTKKNEDLSKNLKTAKYTENAFVVHGVYEGPKNAESYGAFGEDKFGWGIFVYTNSKAVGKLKKGSVYSFKAEVKDAVIKSSGLTDLKWLEVVEK